METVKKGRKQGGWAKNFECKGDGGGCGAVLLVSQTDLYKTDRYPYDVDSSEYLITFCCPECGVETDVEGVSAEPFGKRPSERTRKAIARNKKAIKYNPRKKINIVLGSTSAYKLNAVRKACERLGMNASVSGVETSSGQNAQPFGFEETFRGARARAIYARTQNADAIAVGIESGIFRFCRQKGTPFDIAVIVLLTLDNRQIVTTSAGIEFPEECVKIAESRGFELTTVGSIIAEKFGGDPADPHSMLTKGRVSREMILTDAIVMAIGQI